MIKVRRRNNIKKASASVGYGGFTIIEVMITTFIIGTVVVGLFGLFVLDLRTNQEAERRVVAIALTNERMEMVRNLPYSQVGTNGGVPAGAIAATEEIERNNLTYTVTTDIRYVDDPFDGSVPGGSQEPEFVTICHIPPGDPGGQGTLVVGATALDAHLAHGDSVGPCGGGESTPPGDLYNADYKQVRIAVSWNSPNNAPPIIFIGYVAPRGIEGGDFNGTLDFQATNALGNGLEGATVLLVNDTVNPTINISTQTNFEGRVILPGLPASADSYQLSVTLEDYTGEQTYDSTANFVPDADHSHLSMIVSAITSKTFVIDELADLAINTKDDSGQTEENVPFALRGTKTIGLDGAGDAVYVLDDQNQTDATGRLEYTGLVWDSYDFTIDGVATGFDIKETNLLLPIILNPADILELVVTLVPHTDYSLHITVVDPGGLPIDNATVHLTGNGADVTLGTGINGQVFFADLPANGDYTLETNAPSYNADNQTITVTDTTRERIQLNAI